MWKIALSNPWLYSACRAFFPACGVIHETFTSLSNPWLYWGAFRDDTKNGCVADYTINWYVQAFERRLILTWCEKLIALSNPNVDVRILAQGYFVAINSLSLLWTFNKMKYAKPCLLWKQETERIEWFAPFFLIVVFCSNSHRGRLLDRGRLLERGV